MTFLMPTISLYIFTGHKTEEELISILAIDPDDAWTMEEESEHFTTDTGKSMYYIAGPHSTGARYDSPLNNDPTADYSVRLNALLDRLDPMIEPLANLRQTHSYPFGNMEVVLRLHAVVGPSIRTGLVIDPETITRIIAMEADVIADFAFTPFDTRDGNRYRPRTPEKDRTAVE